MFRRSTPRGSSRCSAGGRRVCRLIKRGNYRFAASRALPSSSTLPCPQRPVRLRSLPVVVEVPVRERVGGARTGNPVSVFRNPTRANMAMGASIVIIWTQGGRYVLPRALGPGATGLVAQVARSAVGVGPLAFERWLRVRSRRARLRRAHRCRTSLCGRNLVTVRVLRKRSLLRSLNVRFTLRRKRRA